MPEMESGEISFQQEAVRRLTSSLGAVTALVESVPETDSDWVADEGAVVSEGNRGSLDRQ